jgi:uronate dehydrogenase
LDEECDLRPDGFYGLSKAYGELLARLYWDKHGVESLSIRIGTCLPKPKEPRHLSTWLSHDDLISMIEAGLRRKTLTATRHPLQIFSPGCERQVTRIDG